jgi:methionyl-tRNA synthetase
MKMATTNLDACPEIPEQSIPEDWIDAMNNFDIKAACDIVFRHVSELDAIIQAKEPFKLVKTDREAGITIIKDLVVRLYTIARMLNPILPETNEKLKALIRAHQMPENPLFLRKD